MDLARLSKCGKIINYKANDIICLEKQQGDTAYLLLQGKANVVLGSFNDTHRKMAELPTGTIFGEMSLLEGNPRSATVLAAGDDTIALEIGKTDFLNLMQTEPELAYKLLRTMYTRMEDSMNNHSGYLVAFNAEVRKDATYQQISKLSEDQFKMIVAKDGQHAVKLLTYLSHKITEIDRKVIEVTK